MAALLAAALTLLATVEVASAQPRYTARDRLFNLQRFSQAPAAERFVTVEPSAAARHLELGLSYFVTYADQPLRLFGGSDEKQPWVAGLVAQSITASLGLFDRLQLGLGLPYTIATACGDAPGAGSADPVCLAERDAALRSDLFEGGGFNDLILTLKGALLDNRDGGLGLAVGLELTLPIDQGGPFSGYNNLPEATDDADRDEGENRAALTFAPRLMLDYRRARWHVGINLGLRLQRDFVFLPDQDELRIGDELLFGAAGGLSLSPRLDVIVEVWGATLLGLDGGTRETPVEVLGAARYRLGQRFALIAGGGGALVRGYGAGRVRLFVGLATTLSLRARDADGDRIGDAQDRCPEAAEDHDGFVDDDGCPDPDNDGDGVADRKDRCPFLYGPRPTGCPRP